MRTGKKILCMLLAFFLIALSFPMMSGVSAAAPASGTGPAVTQSFPVAINGSYDNINFNTTPGPSGTASPSANFPSDSSGILGNVRGFVQNQNSYGNTTSYGGVDNNPTSVFYLDSTPTPADTGTPKSINTFKSVLSKKVRFGIEYKVMFNNTSSTRGIANINYQSTGGGVDLLTANNRGQFVDSLGNVLYYYNANQWYDIVYDIDLTNSRYSVWIDGVLYVDKQSLGTNYNTTTGIYSYKIIQNGATSPSACGAVYFQNFNAGPSSDPADTNTLSISQQPNAVTANQGGIATLSVGAIDSLGNGLIYQWYSNGTANSNSNGQLIAGATNSSYNAPTTTPGTTYYYVVVTDTVHGNSLKLPSNTAAITVNAASNAQTPVINTQPEETTVTRGANRATLTVSAVVADGGTLSYQWYSNTKRSNADGTAIDGATNASYAAPTDSLGTAFYYVVVTNTNNYATVNQTATGTSQAVGVTVTQLLKATEPTISVQPTGATVNQDESNPIIGVISNVYDGGTLRYQWYSNTTNSNTGGTAIDGAINASYAAPTDTASITFYYVAITNTNNFATDSTPVTVSSQAVAVTVRPHVQSISLPNSVDLMQGTTMSLNVAFEPDNASDTRVTWLSSNPSIATVSSAGIVSGVAIGQAMITATTVDGGKTASTSISVVPYYSYVQSVSLPGSISMADQDTIKLVPKITPSDATNKTVTWTSDNPNVATVDGNGTVTSFALGTATITATTQEGNCIASTVVTVYNNDPSTWDEFAKLRAKWRTVLDGGTDFNVADPDISMKFTSISSTAQSNWDSMTTDPGRTYLWSNLPLSNFDNNANLVSTLARLNAMGLAYSSHGSTLYHNIALRDDITQAMDWLYTNWYNENSIGSGNNWYSGIPRSMANLTLFLYDALTQEEIQNFMKAFDRYIGDISSPEFNSASYATGANRGDILMNELVFGIVSNDSVRLSKVRDQTSPLFLYVTSGDGIYEDGSLIQHTYVAYTGSYGAVMIGDVGSLMYMLNGSPWQVTDPNAENLYRWVTDVFEPIIYKGQTMGMVMGRAISRVSATGTNGYDVTVGIITGIMRLAEFAPADKANYYKSLIKEWVSSNPAYNIYARISDVAIVQTLKNWMDDPSISPVGDGPAHYELNAMARSVHRVNDFAFGVSKSSNRVANYELTNGENGKGWYSGDGMTYLYNSDLNQFGGDFWATVNWYRLPGTTVDSRVRTFDPVKNVQNGDGEGRPTNTWAGGSVLDSLYGASGMMLRPKASNMTANKSWFMFDNEIVALGSGISDDNNLTVESIVEQRQLDDVGDNALTVDGTVKPTTLGWTETNPSVHWAQLAGNVPGSDIGYYFPDAPQLNFQRAQQSGTWSDINIKGPTNLRTSNYMTMWFDHGQNPQNAQYSYVLLPGKSAAETSAYAANPDITILSNTLDAHAVRNNRLNITGFNFFKDTSTTVDEVTSSRASSLMLKKDPVQHKIEVAVSDPTLSNTGTIELEINEPATSVITNDPAVTVTQLYPTIKMTVSLNGSLGKSFNTTFGTGYSVSYDSNGATSGIVPIDSGSYLQGVTVSVYGNTGNLVKTGYTFAGWNISANDNGTSYAAGTTYVMGTSNIIFYAKWTVLADATLPSIDTQPTGATVLHNGNATLSVAASISDGGTLSYQWFSNPTNNNSGGTAINGAISASYAAPTSTAGTTYYYVMVTNTNSGATGNHTATAVSNAVAIIVNADIASSDQHNNNQNSNSTNNTTVQLPEVPKMGSTAAPVIVVIPGKPIIDFKDIKSIESIKEVIVGKIKEAYSSTPAAFTDTTNHWASEGIKIFSKMGAINGYNDGSFKPDADITRGEFAAMIAKVFPLASGADKSIQFVDVNGSWAHDAILVLATNGIINGYDDGTFHPEKNITRAEMIAIISRIINMKDADKGNAVGFGDISKSWAKEYIQLAAAAGIIYGESADNFAPEKSTTRAEAVIVLLRSLELSPELAKILDSLK